MSYPPGCDIVQLSNGQWRAFMPGVYNDLPFGYSPPAVDTEAEAIALLPDRTDLTPEQATLFAETED